MAGMKWEVCGMFVFPYFCQERLLPLNSYFENSFQMTFNFRYSRGVFKPSQRSKMELFEQKVKGFQLITIFTKSSILDV